MTEMRVADAVAEYFVREGVEHCFGFNGHGVWAIIDALIDRPEIKGIQPRHEAQAVHMADGYYRVSHRLAPVILTVGPGVLNAPGAVANAMHDSSAVVVLAGATPTHFFDKGGIEEIYYHHQEDCLSVMRPLVKRAWLAIRPDVVPDILAKAFKVASAGRPGPVIVYLPFDIQHHKVKVEAFPEPARRKPNVRLSGSRESMREAAELLAKAERPLIVAGGGVLLAEAWGELRELAETFNFPVVTTMPGKGAIPEDHPLSLGSVGRAGWECGAKASREADVVLAVGCRFTDCHTGGWRPGSVYSIPPTRLIHIDIDPNEIGRNYPVDVGIVGDAKVVLRDLIEILKTTMGKRPQEYPWLRSVRGWREAWENRVKSDAASEAKPIHPARLIWDVRGALPRDVMLFIDTGDVQQFFPPYGRIYEPLTFFNNAGMCQMGWSAGAVLGGKLARPGRDAVAILGDGAFLMASYAMATAVEYGIRVVWVVLNNFGLNIERTAQIANYGREAWGSFRRAETGELYNPDFAKLAEAYGVPSERVESPGEIRPAMERALRAREPYLVEAVVDREVPTYFCPGVKRGYPTSWSELTYLKY